jgi:hypothetical protein
MSVLCSIILTGSDRFGFTGKNENDLCKFTVAENCHFSSSRQSSHRKFPLYLTPLSNDIFPFGKNKKNVSGLGAITRFWFWFIGTKMCAMFQTIPFLFKK